MGIFDKAKDLLRGRGKGTDDRPGQDTTPETGADDVLADTPITQADTTGLTESIDDKTPDGSAIPPAEDAATPADEDMVTQAGTLGDASDSVDEATPARAATDGEDTDTDAGAEGDMPAPEGDFRPTAE